MGWITKSVRLGQAEADAMAELAANLGYSEGQLLRRWVVQGLREMKFDQALLDYTKGLVSLEQAAERATMTTGAFEAELLRRGIFGPGYTDDSPAEWLKGLSRVAQRMGLPKLAELASDLGNQSEGQAAGLAEAAAGRESVEP